MATVSSIRMITRQYYTTRSESMPSALTLSHASRDTLWHMMQIVLSDRTLVTSAGVWGEGMTPSEPSLCSAGVTNIIMRNQWRAGDVELIENESIAQILFTECGQLRQPPLWHRATSENIFCSLKYGLDLLHD